MTLTNKFNLPEPFVRAVARDKKPGMYSVTSLINPTRLMTLQDRHWDELEEDVSDKVWALFGSSVHYILEKAGEIPGYKIEQRLTINRLGVEVVGRVDLIKPDGTLVDYKTVSVYSFLLGDKKGWESQANIYALMAQENGFDIKKLEITAFLKDWSKFKASKDSDYPSVAVHTKEIPLWPKEKTENFLAERIGLLLENQKLPDGWLTPCTDEERWARPAQYACMKTGRKSAMRVFDTENQAKNYITENPGLKIEYRPGAYVRCDTCVVRDFCNQFNGNKNRTNQESLQTSSI